MNRMARVCRVSCLLGETTRVPSLSLPKPLLFRAGAVLMRCAGRGVGRGVRVCGGGWRYPASASSYPPGPSRGPDRALLGARPAARSSGTPARPLSAPHARGTRDSVQFMDTSPQAAGVSGCLGPRAWPPPFAPICRSESDGRGSVERTHEQHERQDCCTRSPYRLGSRRPAVSRRCRQRLSQWGKSCTRAPRACTRVGTNTQSGIERAAQGAQYVPRLDSSVRALLVGQRSSLGEGL